jgi:hypothetical protein
VLLGSTPCLGQNQSLRKELPFYTLVPTYAIGDRRSEDRGFPVIAYLPSRTLLFNVKLGEPVANLGSTFSHAITQDGVPVNIYNPFRSRGERTISRFPLLCDDDSPFPECDADLLVFSTAYDLCRSRSCPDVLPMNPGDIALISGSDDEFIELKVNVGEVLGAVIGVDDLSEAQRNAKVTRVNLNDPRFAHPHFQAQVVSSELLRTECGEGAGAENTGSEQEISDLEALAIEHFGLGRVDRSAAEPGKGVWIAEDFGKSETLWEHRFYAFESRREPEETRQFLAQIEYACTLVGTRVSLTAIERVSLAEVGANDSIVRNIVLEPWMDFGDGADVDAAREKIRESTADPFLWSTNTPQHYFDLMETLVEKLENRALAGFFYAEFNRTCSSSDRRNDICTTYRFE